MRLSIKGKRLHKACKKGSVNTVKLLIGSGAVGVDEVDENGASPLVVASSNGLLDIVRLLLESGADMVKAERWGQTPLYVASQECHLEIVRLLIEAGADKDKADNDGETPLWSACYNGHLEIVRLLVEAGADKDKPNMEGDTPCGLRRQQTSRTNAGIVRLLLEEGAGKNMANKHGQTPLWSASAAGNADVVRLLIGANVDMERKATKMAQHR